MVQRRKGATAQGRNGAMVQRRKGATAQIEERSDEIPTT